ncbi:MULTISPECIES: protein kinase [unclassified Nonomuraea]|uniref:serine/threonine-protein kinase n=1 Tax=unclassified Nonomuraea TaxID=2593643 RepID=UPI0033D12DDD
MEWSAPGYTEVKQLGSGGSGRVVLAVHDETGVRVAVKYLSEALRRDPEALARFQSEARLLVTLRDPHIATMWEYVQDHDGAAIVMELVNGVSLRALLRENGTTGPEAALTVLKGSLLGLARAHRLRLVHKDYKPENVIVRDDGVSKLVDFGIAVREGATARPEGTPPYMAPELWAGAPASPATDVYAVTAVFFECLTGHRPYRSTEPSVLGYQHVYAPIPVQDAPEPVRELLMRGLAKDPADRPRGAEAFVAELEETARAAYGDDWEERGRRRLAGLVALLALLLPVPETPPAQVSTSLARTVFRGGHELGRTVARAARHNAVRLAMGAGLAVVVAVAAVFVLASRDRLLPRPIDVAAAAPSDSAGPAELVSPPATPVGATESPTPEPAVFPPESTGPAVVVPATSGGPTPPATRGRTPTPPPVRITRRPTPRVTVTPPATQPPATRRPTTSPPTTLPPTTPPPPPPTTPPPSTPPPGTPPPGTPAPTPVPATSVAALALGGLTVNEDAVAAATVTIRATGAAPIAATATWAVAGEAVHTERLRLSGGTSYTRALSHTLAERPCGRTVTLTVATTPAAPGGARTATLSVPPCPTTVTGLRVSLDMSPSPGTGASARVRVTTSGTGEVPVQARFAVNGDTVGTGTATLAGRTSYSRSFGQGFRTRPCGATLSVTVTAGGEQASARTRVTCPPGVRRVSIVRATVDGRGGAVSVVTVSTVNDRPVRLAVTFSAGGRQHTEQLTLSGDTSYTRTLSHAFGELPCGARWAVRAATRPRAAGGGDAASGSTPECPPEEEPSHGPEPSTDPPSSGPSVTPSPRPDEPTTDRPTTDRPSTDRPAPGEPG